MGFDTSLKDICQLSPPSLTPEEPRRTPAACNSGKDQSFVSHAGAKVKFRDYFMKQLSQLPEMQGILGTKLGPQNILQSKKSLYSQGRPHVTHQLMLLVALITEHFPLSAHKLIP